MKKLVLIIPIVIAAWLLLRHPGAEESAPRSVISSASTSLPSKVAEESTSTAPTVSFYPQTILQGDPAEIVVNGTSTNEVRSIVFDGKVLSVFDNSGKASAFVGIDLKGRTGSYPVIVTLADGEAVKKNLVVNRRAIEVAPLGIPEKLGGNTATSTQTLVNTLVQEGAIISAVKSGAEKLWSGKFIYPINPPIVITDVYGYSRQTNGTSISHKGTDFRAATGTPVYAINSGVVKYTDYLRNYGNTIIVDHGTGILSIYMHLSEVDVKAGERVERGALIAKSGDTGYVLGPHLHLTIRINGVSIDPMKFYALLGQ